MSPKPALQEADRSLGTACLLFILIAAGGVMADQAEQWWKDLRPGTPCTIAREAYGVKNLGEAYDQLKKAQDANDDFGLAELAQRGSAVPLAAGTSCLIIDSNFFTHFAKYRQ